MTRDPAGGKLPHLALVAGSFSPAAPVNDAELFAYRDEQVRACVSAIFQRGLHIALYGERGVGKTSLANILPVLVKDSQGLQSVRVDCDTEDTYRTLWRKVFRELGLPFEYEEAFQPEDVRRALGGLKRKTLIVIDELDRMSDDDGLSLLADTIKTLSDHSIESTLMLVGVADSLEALLGEHESIVRSLLQVQMPRMSDTELESIIDKGLARARLTMQAKVRSRIVVLSEGLPHFTHLLALQSGTKAVENDRTRITMPDLAAAMHAAAVTHSHRGEYDRATFSPQPGHLFEHVLLACAYAPRDDLGFFQASGVREPLAIIRGEAVTIASFQRHLAEFAAEARGGVLNREGQPRKYRFRFRNPLLQPFIKIRALSKGLITEAQYEQLESLRDPDGALRGGVDPDHLM